jgi:hypothetical protein
VKRRGENNTREDGQEDRGVKKKDSSKERGKCRRKDGDKNRRT